MTEITGEIRSGDYVSAGQASKRIKDALKRIGADPAAVRRAMVAAYEAEMNVVIHTRGGTLRAAVTPEKLDVLVNDIGPGITDIAQAMREGFSTAPPEARDLGFGAGMGLPNIRRNTDRFSIFSEPDKGTRLRFTIFLEPHAPAAAYTAAVRITPERCKQCLRCLHVCPTQAVRIRNGAPIILPHLCIGCAACRMVCPEDVYGIGCPDNMPTPEPDTTLFVPAPLRGQFGGQLSEETLRNALKSLGWNTVWFSDPWESALEDAVKRYAREQTNRPVLTPVCPAVVNLIQVRYPSLLEYVPPFMSALESARESLSQGRGVFVVPCAALCTLAHESSALHPCVAVSPGGLLRRLAPLLKTREEQPPPSAARPDTISNAPVSISGIDQVCQFLDEVEDGRVNDCGVVALYACDSGCFGAPVWPEHPEVSRYRSATDNTQDAIGATALYRPKLLEARTGLRLDADMNRAIEKLARIDRIRAQLPGRDCGVCGSPTCLALAEDIVMARADAQACVYKKQDDDNGTASSDKENAP